MIANAGLDTGLAELSVLITGASGGIGFATAELFAHEGSFLALHANARGDELAARVEARRLPPNTACFSADLRSAEASERLLASAVERFGRVDVCIVNAGIWPPEDQPLHRMSAARLREVIDVNLLGALHTARAFLGALERTGPRSDGRGTSLCFVGSTAGRFGERGHVEYAASKAALRGVLLTLKNEIVELDPRGRVNLVEPGWTATSMADGALSDDALLRRSLATTPLRQLARPSDVASALVFLSSPVLARHVTGEVLTVAGGMEGRLRWTPDQIDPAALRRGASAK